MTSQQMFGLDKLLQKEQAQAQQEKDKKIVIIPKTVNRGKGLYSFVKRL